MIGVNHDFRLVIFGTPETVGAHGAFETVMLIEDQYQALLFAAEFAEERDYMAVLAMNRTDVLQFITNETS